MRLLYRGSFHLHQSTVCDRINLHQSTVCDPKQSISIYINLHQSTVCDPKQTMFFNLIVFTIHMMSLRDYQLVQIRRYVQRARETSPQLLD